jgi:hypothetical protein
MKSRALEGLRLVATIAWLPVVWTFLISAPTPVRADTKKLLWGDTHVHSSLSPDSFLNRNFTLGPDEALRFAKGEGVVHPTTGARVRIDRPLDFLLVADHAESFGTIKRANEERGLPREGLGLVDWSKSWLMEKFFRFAASDPSRLLLLMQYSSPGTIDVVEAARNPAGFEIPNVDLVLAEAWRDSTEASDRHDDPGRFTALIGWEWSATPGGANLHRIVVTDSDADVAQTYRPFSSSTSSHPEDLWDWLEGTSKATGADFVAIPHNSNISRGYMFPAERRLRDTPIDRDWIDRRARWETVVEATQVKGDSETDLAVSPGDPFAEFETYPHYIYPEPIPWSPGPGDFVRSALRTGLAIEAEYGANPYRFGVIGSTDSHTGLSTAAEPYFWGKFPTDSTLDGKRRSTNGIENFGWAMSASGLAGVWAEENTRKQIVAAFRRREVYATTGSRIALRVFAGPDYVRSDLDSTDDADIRSRGVPMGGVLSRSEAPPRILVQATMDPESAPLERVQIVKGWLESDGRTKERIYDVAWAGNRSLDASGALPPVGEGSVEVDGSAITGAASLDVVWTDPDFDPSQPAFYYARVLEMPTPRHSTLDAIALGIDPAETGFPETIQERAYGSAIHYRP